MSVYRSRDCQSCRASPSYFLRSSKNSFNSCSPHSWMAWSISCLRWWLPSCQPICKARFLDLWTWSLKSTSWCCSRWPKKTSPLSLMCWKCWAKVSNQCSQCRWSARLKRWKRCTITIWRETTLSSSKLWTSCSLASKSSARWWVCWRHRICDRCLDASTQISRRRWLWSWWWPICTDC